MTDSWIANIHAEVLAGGRISDGDFLLLEEKAGLYELAFLANAIRQRLHPGNTVTYVIDRNINYTDICVSACKFCAFFKAPEDGGGYLLSFAELDRKIAETKALGGTQVLLQGGLHPDQPLEYYEEMLRSMKKSGIHVHGFSPPEVQHFSQLSGLGIRQGAHGMAGGVPGLTLHGLVPAFIGRGVVPGEVAGSATGGMGCGIGVTIGGSNVAAGTEFAVQLAGNVIEILHLVKLKRLAVRIILLPAGRGVCTAIRTFPG